MGNLIIIFLLLGFLDSLQDILWRSGIKIGKLELKRTTKTWTNKYRLPLEPGKRYFYNLWYKPKYLEKFLYSATILVWLTDPHHFIKFLKTIVLVTGFIIVQDFNAFVFLTALTTYGIASHLSYVFLETKMKS